MEAARKYHMGRMFEMLVESWPLVLLGKPNKAFQGVDWSTHHEPIEKLIKHLADRDLSSRFPIGMGYFSNELKAEIEVGIQN